MELKLPILQSVAYLLHLDLLFVFELSICVTCEETVVWYYSYWHVNKMNKTI